MGWFVDFGFWLWLSAVGYYGQWWWWCAMGSGGGRLCSIYYRLNFFFFMIFECDVYIILIYRFEG